MKKLQLHSGTFQELILDFKQDLVTRNYSPSLVGNMPTHIREFFHYLESKGHENLEFVTTKLVTTYYEYLSTRRNQTRGGALSNGSLNKHQEALKLFLKYLKNNGFKMTFGVHLRTEPTNSISEKDILSQDEIIELFDACDYSHVSRRFQLRDKAILVVLYSCGLRRNEAVGINLSDIDMDKKQIYIRNGSRNKKRLIPYVPINDFNIKILDDYINYSRPHFYRSEQNGALFVNKNGNRLLGKSFADRLLAIVRATENESILERHITPHTLRHSVATHLLQRGMPIEKVSEFLGHSSLESTQIYTHIIDAMDAD